MKISSRREFLRNAAYVTLAVTVLPRAGLSDDETPDPARRPEEDSLKIHSGESHYFPLPGHLHTLSIPLEAIQNPPKGGIRPKTTWAYLHHHVVPLTDDQLYEIARGDVVLVTDTVKDHLYEIRLLDKH